MKTRYIAIAAGLILFAAWVLITWQAVRSSTAQAQGPQPIATVIDTPMTFGPLYQAQGVATAGVTTIDEPAVFPSDPFHSRALDAQAVDFEQKVIELFNIERQKKGLPPVVRNSYLTKASQDYAQFLATCGCQMGHNADGSSPWDRIPRAGYQGSLGGEVLAGGQPSPEEVVKAWVNSPGHFAILTGAYGETGVGFAAQPGSQYTYYWASDWGGSPGCCGGDNNPPPAATVTPFYFPPTPTRFVFPTPVLFRTPTPFYFPPTATPWFNPPATATPFRPPPTQTPIPQSNSGFRLVVECNQFMSACTVTSIGPR